MGRDGVGYLFPNCIGWAEMGWDIYFPIALDGPTCVGIILPQTSGGYSQVFPHNLFTSKVLNTCLGEMQIQWQSSYKAISSTLIAQL
jgi:hypothetical protein